MRYQYSSPLALAMTCTLYGRAVYGPDNHVWYYECVGESPHIRIGISDVVPFILRFYPGDCNLGESGFVISFDKEQFREPLDVELNSAVLRSGIDHDSEQHYRNVRARNALPKENVLHLVERA